MKVWVVKHSTGQRLAFFTEKKFRNYIDNYPPFSSVKIVAMYEGELEQVEYERHSAD